MGSCPETMVYNYFDCDAVNYHIHDDHSFNSAITEYNDLGYIYFTQKDNIYKVTEDNYFSLWKIKLGDGIFYLPYMSLKNIQQPYSIEKISEKEKFLIRNIKTHLKRK